MPYPNEHSARLQDPSKFNKETYKRVNDGIIYGKIKVPQTVAVIWGKFKGRDKPSDNPIPQALRFPVKHWTAEKARKWLKDNNIKYIKFEPASGKKEKSEVSISDIAQKKYNCECVDCGYEMESDKHCKDIKCPKCGGQMRRKERPGPGRNQSLNYESLAANSIFALIAQLEAQYWVMEARALQGLFTQLAKETVYLPDSIEIAERENKLRIDDDVAVINIHGILLKQVPKAFRFWDIEATSYLDIAEQVNSALANDKVKSILLHVSSPGGVVPGVLDTAEIIRHARSQKPVKAFIDDIGASGAYWLASQADTIEAEANSTAGSIGVYTVYVDSSKRAESEGFKVHVIRSGELKGIGIPGTEITDKKLATIQEIIDGIADNFVKDVAAGRKRNKGEIKELATGQLWLADKAVKLGLIDSIQAVKRKSKTIKAKENTMGEPTESTEIDDQIQVNQVTEETQKAERQRMADLKTAFPDDLDFAMQAFEKDQTVEQAKAEHYDILQKQAREDKAKTTSGASAIVTEDTDGETEGNFMDEARKLVADGKAKTMTEAMRKVRRQNPQLHEAFKEQSKAKGKAAVYGIETA